MDPFEYAMALISIVLGLAISDIAMSLHKLVRHRSTIHWDARVLLAAAFTFVTVFAMWFETWSIHGRPEILSFPFLLSLVVELSILFMMATTVLPDDPPKGTDLRDFYDETSRHLWTFFLLFQISYVAHWLYFVSTFSSATVEWVVSRAPRVLVPLIVAVILLIWPKNRKLHLILVPLLLAFFLYRYWNGAIAN